MRMLLSEVKLPNYLSNMRGQLSSLDVKFGATVNKRGQVSSIATCQESQREVNLPYTLSELLFSRTDCGKKLCLTFANRLLDNSNLFHFSDNFAETTSDHKLHTDFSLY